jgi:VWFA-related protein
VKRRGFLWLPAAQDDFVFRAGTAQVRVDAQVSSGGKAILGLTKEDFVVTDGGARVPLEYCGQDEEAVSVLLLLDVSGSMKRYVEQMSKAAQRALSFLKSQDRAGVMVFSKDTKLTLPLTASLKEAAREIDLSVSEHKLPSGTAINASLLDAAEAMRKDRAEQKQPGRYAILILTDNGSLNYRVPDEQVMRALFQADTVLNAIVVGKDRGRRTRQINNEDFSYPDVYKLAEESGGEAVAVERADQAFPEMMRAIRQRYALSYRLPEQAKPGEFRALRVELSAALSRKYPRAAIRARAGYYVPAA